MKRIPIAILAAGLAGMWSVVGAFAQAGGLTLSLSRDFGYGGLNGDIQGTFTLTASGPADLRRVQFFIDQAMIGEVTRVPFKLQFVTDNYPAGIHSLSATGITSSGAQLESPKLTANFVTAEQGTKRTMELVVPVLVIVFGGILLAALVPLFTGRKTVQLASGTPRPYPHGGTVCPKCGRPFAFHLLAMNLPGSKLDRCPYCGKWSLARRASSEALRAAELAELDGAAVPVPELSAEERLKKDLDDSKYQSL